MNHWRSLDDAFPSNKGMCGNDKVVRERGSKLDVHREFIDNWLVSRAKASNKQRYSQRALARALKMKCGMNVTQSALSRFFKKHQLEKFFHA